MSKAAGLLVALALAAGIAGCRVHVDKGANGEDKNVQVDTPFGGVHVNTDQTTASDLGLPVYPGAQSVKGDDEHKSADVPHGFWRVAVARAGGELLDADAEDKVVTFYKKRWAAMGRDYMPGEYSGGYARRDLRRVDLRGRQEGRPCADLISLKQQRKKGRKKRNIKKEEKKRKKKKRKRDKEKKKKREKRKRNKTRGRKKKKKKKEERKRREEKKKGKEERNEKKKKKENGGGKEKREINLHMAALLVVLRQVNPSEVPRRAGTHRCIPWQNVITVPIAAQRLLVER